MNPLNLSMGFWAPLSAFLIIWLLSCIKVVNEYERAKVIAAEGELLASQQLLEAANTISQNPTAIQMRYLQTLAEISIEKNSTIVFPLPMEIMRAFEKLSSTA